MYNKIIQNFIFIIFLLIPDNSIAQNIISSSISDKLLYEYRLVKNLRYTPKKYDIALSNLFYMNTNLPNFENINGLNLTKGIGAYTSFYYGYYGQNIYFTVEQIFERSKYSPNIAPLKKGIFSKLNDVNNSDQKSIGIQNFGFVLRIKNLSIGYGNWNHWAGSGIHNSLIYSNNTKGFYNYIIDYKGNLFKNKKIKFETKYLLSEELKNYQNINFYITTLQSSIIYKNLQISITNQTLSGGFESIEWSMRDAALVNIKNKMSNYADFINTIDMKYGPDNEGLLFFVNIGLPNRNLFKASYNLYNDNGLGSIIGLRKYGFFGNQNISVGFEYLRLVQGIYYNLIPTPNWYDNIRYDYSSYQNQRWGAHSGSDSDDFLIYIALINSNFSLMYGINYERHGVTYKFPPEVKIENKISLAYKFENLEFLIDYETEYFEHYAFLDNNSNVWQETFELGSLQRTNTLLFKLNYNLSKN